MLTILIQFSFHLKKKEIIIKKNHMSLCIPVLMYIEIIILMYIEIR